MSAQQNPGFVRQRLTFLALAFTPQLTALAVVALLLYAIDSPVQAPSIVESATASKGQPAAVVTSVVASAFYIWAALMVGWYCTDAAVTRRREGFQLVAPSPGRENGRHSGVWIRLIIMMLIIPMIALSPFIIRDLLLSTKQPWVVAFLLFWTCRCSFVFIATTNLALVGIALARQHAFKSYEQLFKDRMAVAQEKREKLRSRHRRKCDRKRREAGRLAYRHKLHAFYEDHRAVLAPVYTPRVFEAAIIAATDSHLTVEQAARASQELLDQLQTLVTQADPWRILKQLQAQRGKILDELQTTQAEREKLTKTGANTTLLDEHVALCESRINDLDRQIASGGTTTPSMAV